MRIYTWFFLLYRFLSTLIFLNRFIFRKLLGFAIFSFLFRFNNIIFRIICWFILTISLFLLFFLVIHKNQTNKYYRKNERKKLIIYSLLLLNLFHPLVFAYLAKNKMHWFQIPISYFSKGHSLKDIFKFEIILQLANVYLSLWFPAYIANNPDYRWIILLELSEKVVPSVNLT